MNNNRLASIDSFRALTMLLMIFVIDLWSVNNSPVWLSHAGADEDRMGLADVVLPCFMFIIGLSIPHAVKARLDLGGTWLGGCAHILIRSISLIFMGLIVVNFDNINAGAMIIPRSYWQLIMVIAILLIWNQYRSDNVFNVVPKRVMQATGWALIGFLGFVFKGHDGSWMQIHWWGILGLLGWSYGVCAFIYLLASDRLLVLGVAVLGFMALNINEFIGDLHWRFVVSASNYFSVMLGVFCSAMYVQLQQKRNTFTALVVLACLAILLVAFGFATRPEWGISKILATPSWTTICAGISISIFIAMVILVDVKKHKSCFSIVKAGGTATLTCYFAQYFVYSVMDISGAHWPEFVQHGYLGLLRSLLFSVLIIQMVYWAGKINIKLNI